MMEVAVGNTAPHTSELSAFMHTATRSIIGITKTEVIEDIINDIRERNIFFNIPDVRSQIATKQCRFVGKVVRGPDDHPPKQLLIAWCNNPCLFGHPITTNRVLIVKSL